MANIASRPESLQDYLLHQLGELDVDADVERLAERIISEGIAFDTQHDLEEPPRRRRSGAAGAPVLVRAAFADVGVGGVTVSIGVASVPAHADNANVLLECADSALYRAKAAGKNCVVLYAPRT